jgi:hypothetical protein
LFDWIRGYTPGNSVDIRLTEQSKEKIRVMAMYGEWTDLLMLREVGENLSEELDREFDDHEFFYFFVVGPVSRFESNYWGDCIFYVDIKTSALIQRHQIISPYRAMPKRVYDLAFDEACRISEEQAGLLEV